MPLDDHGALDGEYIGPTGSPATERSVLLAQEMGGEKFAKQILGPCMQYITDERLDEFLSSFPDDLRQEVLTCLRR